MCEERKFLALTSVVVYTKNRRNLSQDEQLGYIDAVKCMMSTAGRTSSLYAGVVSAYDDYQALHIAMTEKIHFNVRVEGDVKTKESFRS